MKQTALILFSMLLANFATHNAQADFQGDVLQEALAPHPLEKALKSHGIRQAPSVSEIDFNAQEPITPQEFQAIRGVMLETFQNSPALQANFDRLAASMTSRYAYMTNILVYVGIDVGYVLGINTNVAAIFGRDRNTRELVVSPGLIARIQAVSLGTDIHMGLGQLQGDVPAFTWGFTVGGAYVLGAGIGESWNWDGMQELWVEIKAGIGVQIGPYIEVIL